jgi:hypothetical protein
VMTVTNSASISPNKRLIANNCSPAKTIYVM